MTAATHLDVFVPGTPAAQGSKRHVGGGRMVESSKALGPWRSTVTLAVHQACPGPALTGAVAVSVEFVLPRPKSTPKRSTPPHIRKPDVDKLIRAVFDAVTDAGVVWGDDSQVDVVQASKRTAEVGETPGVRIVAWPHLSTAAVA